jgi:N-acetylglucosamine-6-phosphate deacetylase
MQFIARRYDNDRTVLVEVAEGRIAKIIPARAAPDLPYIAPGLVDLQINGYGGIEFNDPHLTVEQVHEAALSQLPFGVTSFLATCTTDSEVIFAHSFATIAKACELWPEVAARIPGIHLEGPFICPEDGPRGAHPREHVRPPDWELFERLQAAAQGLIRLVTLSPEYDEAPAFIAKAVASGVTVAIGHTQATGDQIRAAADAGATLSTHLGNGAHPLIRRHPNYIWEQLAEDRLTATLIADGHHLPPSVVKAMIRAKGLERCLLVSDITSLGGMPAGEYQTRLGTIEVLPNGKLVAAGRKDILAGASAPLHVGVAKVMQFAGLSLSEAIDLASAQAARAVGLCPSRLEADSAANFFLFDLPKEPDEPLIIRQTVAS